MGHMQDMQGNKWLRLLMFVPSITMIYMDQSVLPVALPVIQQEFHVSAAALQWAVNIYLLGWTVFVILGGKIGDRIGHRINYLSGMVCFALFSAMCGLSPNIGLLICARGLQGIAGAFMITAQIALISSLFPAHSRGRAIGILVSIGSVFLILGPMIGGFLTDWLSWRWIFWINLPIAFIGVIFAFFLVPHTVRTAKKIDLWGFLFFAFFSVSASLIFMQGENWGWKSVKIISAALIALISLALLWVREKTSKHPFLDLSLFKRPIFAAINVNISMCQFVAMIFVFRTIYTETILGYSPTNAGLIISISSLPVLFFSYIGGYLADKVSPKLPITLGYMGVILSFFWLGFMPTPSLAFYFPPLLIFGMGMTLIFTPSLSTALNHMPPEKTGIAYGIINTLRMFSGTMGLSLIFAFVSFEQNLHAPKVGARIAEIISFSSIHFVLGFLMVIAFITTIALHRRKAAHRLPDAPAEGWD